MTRALGLYGGSFDPPHVGHVLTACYVLCTGEIDELWIAPAFAHPFGKPMALFDHRLRMCELAFEPLRHCFVSSLERELGGTSYTVELVEAVAARHPGKPLRMVVGTDILSQTDRWERFERLKELAPLLVVGRAGHASDQVPSDVPHMPEVSSTDIRRRLSRGESVSGRVPEAVARYARKHGLYEEST